MFRHLCAVLPAFLLIAALSPALCSAFPDEAAPAREKVLLVYSSGEIFETITDIKDPAALDAITSPTPADRNTDIAAKRIRDNLVRDGLSVRLACVEEFGKEAWREVLAYDTIIIGSPARFWTMSWETKRFFDLVFGRIYILENKAKGKTFGLFATAEIESSSATALQAMETIIGDVKGSVALRLNLHREMSQEQFDQEIDKFTASLSVLAR